MLSNVRLQALALVAFGTLLGDEAASGKLNPFANPEPPTARHFASSETTSCRRE
jgi:hypothetical protein